MKNQMAWLSLSLACLTLMSCGYGYEGDMIDSDSSEIMVVPPIYLPPRACLYANENYRGESRCFGIGDFSWDLKSEINASSLQLFDTNVLLCDDPWNVGGIGCTYIENDMPSFDNMSLTSGVPLENHVYYVKPAGACLSGDINYKGQKLCLSTGQEMKKVIDSGFDGTFRSIKIHAGTTAYVCEYQNYYGSCTYINTNDANLSDKKYPNGIAVTSRIGSVKILKDYTFLNQSGEKRVVRFTSNYSINLRNAWSTWTETFVQDDEPEKNYCGPTAIKNVLDWYGKIASYSYLGKLTKTNDWLPTGEIFGTCAAVCGIEPICTGSCTAAVKKFVDEGTSPDKMESAMGKLAPDGYTLHRRRSKGNLLDMLAPLSHGSPVVTLLSLGESNLHWVVVTGYYWSSSKQKYMIRIANSDNITWSDFRKHWSLSEVVDSKFLRKFLEHYEIKPYIMMYYSNQGELENVRYYGSPILYKP